MPPTDFGLWITEYELWSYNTMDFGFRTFDYGLSEMNLHYSMSTDLVTILWSCMGPNRIKVALKFTKEGDADANKNQRGLCMYEMLVGQRRHSYFTNL